MAQIQNIVVLMMENRSFDHMLGYLRSATYPIEGLNGNEFNLEDPGNPSSPGAGVNPNAHYTGELHIDPAHDTLNVLDQLFGTPTPAPGAVPTNQWFVYNYTHVNGNSAPNAHNIMNCFAPQHVPALTTLAQSFAVCDHWFASVPGQTWSNRFFVHAATAMGFLDNEVHDYTMRTIYENLGAQGRSWNIYFHDVPQSMALRNLQVDFLKTRFRPFSDFTNAARNGTLPAYSFIEPRYNDFLFWKANDQHPDHDVSLGDAVIADVYEALRSSPQWNQTLFVLLWDEHGGIFDHVPPPRTVNPDGRSSTSPAFDFDQLGARVPAVLVSPWIAKGVIDQRVYDHTSLLATVKKIFGLPNFLNNRDAAANTFEANLSLAEPRTDAPLSLPRVAPPATLAAMSRAMTPESIALGLVQGQAAQADLSEFQRSLVELVNSLDTGDTGLAALTRVARLIETEHEAAVHTQETVARFLGWR